MEDVRRAEAGETHALERPLAACPECGSGDLRPIVEDDGETVNFFCESCHRCWHVELGYVHRVDPTSCSGCREHPRCSEVYASDHRVRSR